MVQTVHVDEFIVSMKIKYNKRKRRKPAHGVTLGVITVSCCLKTCPIEPKEHHF